MAENDPAEGGDAPSPPAMQAVGQDARDVAAVTMAAAPPRRVGGTLALIGRDADLADLDVQFRRTPTVVVTESAEAAGRGGMGLSALARAYADTRCSVWPAPPAVISLARPDLAGLELAAAGLRLGIVAEGPLAQRVEAVLAALRTTADRLLVLDDCPDARSYRAVRPAGGRPTTLVTAGAAPWAPDVGAAEHPLGGLHFQDAAALVASRRPDLAPEMPEVARVAAALDEVPAALAFAAHTLAAERDGQLGDPIAYLRAVRAVPVDDLRLALGSGTRAPAGRERAIVRALAVAAGALRPTHGPDIVALFLLRIAAAFQPGQPFPERLLRRAAQAGEDPPDSAQLNQAAARLRALGLLRDDADGRGPYLPRPVAAYVAGNDPTRMPDARRLAEGAAARTAAEALAEGRVNDVLPWQAHLHHLAELAEMARSRVAGVLMRRLGEQMHALGAPELARALDARGHALIRAHPPA